MEDHAADHLYIEVTHVEHAAAGFSDNGKSFGKDFLENFFEGGLLGSIPGVAGISVVGRSLGYAAEAFVNLLAEVEGLGAELLVRERLSGGVKGRNLVENGLQALDLSLVLGPENLGCNGVNQCGKILTNGTLRPSKLR